jgi:hypothetical protein
MKKLKSLALFFVCTIAITPRLCCREPTPAPVPPTPNLSLAIKNDQSRKPFYEKVGSMRGPEGKNALVLLIAVGSDVFTRDAMTALARQLNQDFKDEEWIHAAIFDSAQAARNYQPVGGSYHLSKQLERGEYVINRITRCEYITYSSARGKPIRENLITIQKPHGSNRKPCPERIEF